MHLNIFLPKILATFNQECINSCWIILNITHYSVYIYKMMIRRSIDIKKYCLGSWKINEQFYQPAAHAYANATVPRQAVQRPGQHRLRTQVPGRAHLYCGRNCRGLDQHTQAHGECHYRDVGGYTSKTQFKVKFH